MHDTHVPLPTKAGMERACARKEKYGYQWAVHVIVVPWRLLLMLLIVSCE